MKRSIETTIAAGAHAAIVLGSPSVSGQQIGDSLPGAGFTANPDILVGKPWQGVWQGKRQQ